LAVIPCTVKSSGYSDAKQEKLIRIKEDKEGAPNTNEDWVVLRQVSSYQSSASTLSRGGSTVSSWAVSFSIAGA